MNLTVSKKGLLAFVLIAVVTLQLLSPAKVSAYLSGRTPVNAQTTTNRTPTITGTIPSWCTDVVVGVGTDQGDTYKYFFSDYGQVQITDNGYSDTSWSLNLGANSYGLVNGVYNIFVASECDYSGSYSDPLYADLHFGALRIIPATCDGSCVPVYRFYNINTGAHFYTTTEHEKRSVLEMPQYRYEGIVAFAKDFRTVIEGMIPVYRFYNFKQGVHFYTSNQAEATYVNNNLGHTFKYEGVAYQAYSYQLSNSSPMHRFYKFRQGVHFYTPNQVEATTVNNTASSTYRYEGISYFLINN